VTRTATARKRNPQDLGLWRSLRSGDLFVVVAVVALAVALWSGGRLASSQATGAVLIRDRTTIRTFTLQEMNTDATYSVESLGYHFTIQTGGGRIRFASSDCPDKVCVQTGWISRPPQVAACVPGHLLLRVNGDSGDVDVING